MIAALHPVVSTEGRKARAARPTRGVSQIEGGVPDSWTDTPWMPMPSAFTPSNTHGRSWTGVNRRTHDVPEFPGRDRPSARDGDDFASLKGELVDSGRREDSSKNHRALGRGPGPQPQPEHQRAG